MYHTDVVYWIGKLRRVNEPITEMDRIQLASLLNNIRADSRGKSMDNELLTQALRDLQNQIEDLRAENFALELRIESELKEL